MAIITLPTKFSFSRVNSFKLQRATNSLRSKYTGQRQTIIYPYAIWMLDAELMEYDGVDAGAIRAFLALLEGEKNSFRLPVPGYIRPGTGYTGNCLANGAAAARAVSITVDGLTASVPIANAGDFFTVNDELKMLTAAVASNGSGQATFNFQSPLRAAVADNTAVTLQNPTCLMVAADDEVADWGIQPPVRQTARLRAIEAV